MGPDVDGSVDEPVDNWSRKGDNRPLAVDDPVDVGPATNLAEKDVGKPLWCKLFGH